MRKRVLFMLISMNVGGTERAFLNKLNELPKEKYEITVLLLQRKGGLDLQLCDYVREKDMNVYTYIRRHTTYNRKDELLYHYIKRRYKQAFFLFVLHYYMKITKDCSIFFRNTFKRVPMLEHEYDIAVAFAGPMDIITYYIAKRVKAKEKYQWIHFDVNEIGFDLKFARKMYKYFDRIYVVSKTASIILKEKLPTLSYKIESQKNTLSTATIIQLARKEDVFPVSSTIRIVTVARIMKEKGPDIAVKILCKLKKLGYNIRWHWIGGGEWATYIKEMIKECKVEDSFILEGLKMKIGRAS